MIPKTFVIDIDDTLFYSKYEPCGECGKPIYHVMGVDRKEIEYINKAYDKGHIIIIFTGRGWNQYKITVEQLKKHGVKYHSLVMGKPHGIYIDKDSSRSIKGLI